MTMYKRILVAVDGSSTSNAALPQALEPFYRGEDG